MATTAGKTGPAQVTVTAVTPGFSGVNQPSAEARCPAGYVCTGGRIDAHDDAAITESRLADDGRGWRGSFTGGPSGGTATVWAQCELPVPAEAAASALPEAD